MEIEKPQCTKYFFLPTLATPSGNIREDRLHNFSCGLCPYHQNSFKRKNLHDVAFNTEIGKALALALMLFLSLLPSVIVLLFLNVLSKQHPG